MSVSASVRQGSFPVIGAHVVAIIESAIVGGEPTELLMRDNGAGADTFQVNDNVDSLFEIAEGASAIQ